MGPKILIQFKSASKEDADSYKLRFFSLPFCILDSERVFQNKRFQIPFSFIYLLAT